MALVISRKVLDEQKKLDEKKRKLSLQEKIIREKEKKSKFRMLVEIGKLANKAGIDEIDPSILLGAFIEISEKINLKEKTEEWKKYSSKFIDQKKEVSSALTIKFNQDPSMDDKKHLKKLNFKWNRFRKEFYGYGNLQEIRSIFSDLNCVVKEIEE